MVDRAFVRAFTLRACEYAKYQYRADVQHRNGARYRELIDPTRELEELRDRLTAQVQELEEEIEKKRFQLYASWSTWFVFWSIIIVGTLLVFDSIISWRLQFYFLVWFGKVVLHFCFTFIRMIELMFVP